MKVLLTGSRGFIGSEVAEHLRKANIPFDVVVRSHSKERECLYAPPIASKSGEWHVSWPNDLATINLAEYSAIVHLAVGRSNPGESETEALASHTEPIIKMLEAIAKTHPTCHLVFTSSQSATSNATSTYGRGKWQTEDVLQQSNASWTIIRPGLVVGATAGGLFGGMLALVRKLPLVPVPSGNQMRIQPVLVSDIATAIVRAIEAPDLHRGQRYCIALSPRTLYAFIGEVIEALNLRRIRIPIPWQIVWFGLWLAELLPFRLPVSRANLEGLRYSEELHCQESLRSLNLYLGKVNPEALRPLHFTPNDETSRECLQIFESIFRTPPPLAVIEQYRSTCEKDLYNGCWINIPSILKRGLDIEAIEFASRGRGTLLSQKVQAICYIAELSPELLPHFISRKTNRCIAYISLGWAGARSAWKLVYGHYLIRRYKLLQHEGSHD